MRRLASLPFLTIAAAVVLIALADVAGAASIYSWRDGAGSLHYSNRPEVVPTFAHVVELPPLPASVPVSPATFTVERPQSHPSRLPTAECGPDDPTGVGEAIVSRLARTRTRATSDLTIIVAGVPVMYRPGTVTTVQAKDVFDERSAPLEQSSIAYPAGSPCPKRPPLGRYAVSSGSRSAPRGLCDDYRRAFADVGVAISRDHRIARSFGALAEDFSVIAAQGYTVREKGRAVLLSDAGGWTVMPALEARARDVRIPPWVVEAHIAQLDELADETADFVEELRVALEEIDRAAQARGCW